MSTKPIDGVFADGAMVTYLLMHDPQTMRPVSLGEFPHCPMWNALPFVSQCPTEIVVGDRYDDSEVRCTRETGHRGQHVFHERPGLPTIAWLETGR